ncbi:hypothetical protein HFN98_03830 [Rhizobium laguerreae]|uniref:hypothetical protein n=1 Tax=Rhizobium laguerreae TaxID=1076926 RepID=UPI001C922495|nr:hypothetical protein [Rhizobium laguerreae]MBY3329784.1 hypothetical protein [Rhizobium laguerreae]
MEPHLKLVIESEAISSTDIAQMLLNLNKSFKAFVRNAGGRSLKAELTVGAVRPGSIEILLDAIDGLGKLYEAREYLAPFASHLAQIFQLALGLQANKQDTKIAPVDRNALTSLAAPVAKGNAQQVNIVNHGSIVLNINGCEEAKALIDSLAARYVAVPEVRQAQPAPRLEISERQIAQLEQGTLMGTAFLVDSSWYARLAEGQGVLVPITVSDAKTLGLAHRESYTFQGRSIHGSRGETIGIAIHDAQRIGSPS